jgi:hypothetical protein
VYASRLQHANNALNICQNLKLGADCSRSVLAEPVQVLS